MDELFDVQGDLLGALRGGVYAVGLDVALDSEDVLKNKGQQGDVVLLRKLRIHAVEASDVVTAVLRGEGDSGERDPCSTLLDLLDHCSEVLLSAADRQAAEAVIAAELEDDDLWFLSEDAMEALQAVLGSVSADAFVEHTVVIPAGIEETLEIGRVAGGGFKAVAGGEAVAEAGDDGAGAGDIDGGLRVRGPGGRAVLGEGVGRRGPGDQSGDCGEGEN